MTVNGPRKQREGTTQTYLGEFLRGFCLPNANVSVVTSGKNKVRVSAELDREDSANAQGTKHVSIATVSNRIRKRLSDSIAFPRRPVTLTFTSCQRRNSNGPKPICHI